MKCLQKNYEKRLRQETGSVDQKISLPIKPYLNFRAAQN